MAAKASFHIAETPVLSPESSKALVQAVKGTRLTSAREAKLKKLAEAAQRAYQRELPLITRIK